MAKKSRPSVAMRREPGSEEGRRIVDAILGAAEHLLTSEDFSQLSTNRIAESAGVSIGSFYHYFPNKECVLAELARALDRRAQSLLEQRHEVIAGSDVREAVRAFVEVLFDARMGGLALRRQLLVHVPRDWLAQESARVDREVQALVCGFLEARRQELTLRSPERATFILFHTVEAVVEAAVEGQPAWIADGSLRRELVRLLFSYLGLNDKDRRPSSVPPEQPRWS